MIAGIVSQTVMNLDIDTEFVEYLQRIKDALQVECKHKGGITCHVWVFLFCNIT